LPFLPHKIEKKKEKRPGFNVKEQASKGRILVPSKSLGGSQRGPTPCITLDAPHPWATTR